MPWIKMKTMNRQKLALGNINGVLRQLTAPWQTYSLRIYKH
jgi:hypothetical protein